MYSQNDGPKLVCVRYLYYSFGILSGTLIISNRYVCFVQGKTPLDTLKDYYLQSREELTSDETEEYHVIENFHITAGITGINNNTS